MIKKALKPLRHVKTLAQKARAKAKAYMGKRPHRSFRKTENPRSKLGGKKLDPVFKHLRSTAGFILKEKKLLAGLTGVYVVAMLLFVGSVTQLDFIGFKESVTQLIGGDFGALGNASALFLAAVTGGLAMPASELQQFLGVLIGFVFWLAAVWVARMRLAGNHIKIRDALYNCCAPLVPSAMIVLVIIVQLLPAAVAVFLFAILQTGGILEGGVEVMMFSIGAVLLFLLSSYWLSASLLALVVVTLPGVYPWKALSAASELIIGQRWTIALHMAVMALVILLLWVAVLIPALMLDGYLRWDWLPLVPLVVQALGAASLVFSSVYIYKLYRNLL